MAIESPPMTSVASTAGSPSAPSLPDASTQLPGDSWNERLWATVEAADAAP